MKTTGQKFTALFLTAFTVMSVMASTLTNTAYAWEPKDGDSCADNQTDLTPYGIPGCEDNANMVACEKDPNKKVPKDMLTLCDSTANTAANTKESETDKETLKKFTAPLIAIEKVINKAIWPVLVMTGGLMNNDILFGPGMEQKLYDIWVPVRNIVNIFFVVALIGLALYSVLGINSENGQYSIKAMLPKIIAGIIAVNFSFIAIKVVLDAVNVFTTSVFAIPTQVQGMEKAILDNGTEGEMPSLREAFCSQLYLDGKQFENKTDFDNKVETTALFMMRDRFELTGVSDAKVIKQAGETLKPEAKAQAFNDEFKKLTNDLVMCKVNESTNKLELSDMGLQFFQKYNSQNAALAMAINMGEIMFYNRTSVEMLASGTYESLAIKVIFIFLMYAIYAASFIALFVVLLARLIVVWMGLAMSPVIALSIAVPMVKDKLGFGELTSKFMKHVIAPVMIAFPMMIGWVMLNALHTTTSDTEVSFNAKDMLVPGIPIPGLETLQGLLISLAAAAVVWIGVFAAAEGTIAGKITGFMKDQLERFGKFIATAPIKYTSWVPVQMGEGKETYSPAALLTAATTKMRELETAGEQQFIAKHPEFFRGGGLTGPAGLNQETRKQDLINIVAQNGEKLRDKEYKERFKKLDTNTELRSELEIMAQSGSPQADRDFATAMLAAIENPETLDKADLNRFQTWANQYMKEHPAGTSEAATAADAAVEAAKKLGYEEKDLEKGKGKYAADKIIKLKNALNTKKELDDENKNKELIGELREVVNKEGKKLKDEEIETMIDNMPIKNDKEATPRRDKLKATLKATAPQSTPTTPPSAQAQGGTQQAPPAGGTQQPGGGTQPPAGGSPAT